MSVRSQKEKLNLFRLSLAYVKKNYLGLIALFAGLLFTVTFASFVVVQKQTSNIYDLEDVRLAEISRDIKIGIVFGGGVKEDEPLPLLRDRLEKAKELVDKGYVDHLILSGYVNTNGLHDEPKAMQKYLLSKGLSPNIITKDSYGHSTYETCERAKKVFGIQNALLVSESTHLPRAIYLCNYFGIDAYGVNSDGEASSGLKIGQRWREVLARNKAVFNVYILGENTILGDPITLN